ncbi:TRAP transporter large permease subunit [Pseudooceanicola sp. 216_PA32_1]|uniref:TRAP transporter large permease protein n=1 Tax=Pseudooceanicola pacificus TaxID=2676438 RepID=A0A844WGE7_9RHOB|nr:TRAP transporter large permease [Pseudooceanicola pacificus]MWB79049.1 TRAP transporter large permease subunit [Pseudooceanicola pacificus]
MDPSTIGLISLALMILLIQLGIHIALVLLVLSFVATWMIRGNIDVAGSLLAKAVETSLQSYSFGVIPLFVAMGLLISVSGVGRDTFDVAGRAFRRVAGGLGMATVAANAVFAAINGSSIASASVFTKLAVPELMRQGYTPRFSVGVVAGSSVLGMLIPPSLLLIFFGIIAEVSIGDLFTAGILPGLLLAGAFMLVIKLLIRINPGLVQSEQMASAPDSDTTLGKALLKLLPIASLIVIVLGGIYGGVFTPVEAGGVGALAALILAALKRRLTLRGLWHVLTETGYVTASISALIIAAHMYANMLALSRLPNLLGNWFAEAEFSFAVLLLIYLVAILLLGTILDAISIILILLPLVQPIMMAQGVDMVWFGIVTIIAVEIGLLTPPLGLAVFVIKTNLNDPDISLNDIFLGTMPFALTMLFVLALIVMFPIITLALV